MCLHATIKLFQQLFPEVWKKAELKANMRPTQKQHNDCWQWDFLPNRLPKLPSYLWKSLRIWAIQKTQVSHVSSTRPRYQNTMVYPHAPGIRRASCPHTPWARSFWTFSPYLNHMRKLRTLIIHSEVPERDDDSMPRLSYLALLDKYRLKLQQKYK